MSHQQTLHLPTGQAITMAPDGSQTQAVDSAGVAAAAAALYAQPVGTTVVAQMPVYSGSNQPGADDDERIYHAESIPSVGGAGVGTRRVPCKARGIAEHHNSATAYFDIPLDAPHGMLLLCSHPACHGSGRRFRYCKVCELPVAKRNFVKRHSHDLKASVISSTTAPPPAPPPLQVTAPGETARLTAVPVPIRFPSEQRKRRSVSYDAADTLNQMMQQGMVGETASKKARSNNVVTTAAAPGPSILKIPTAPAPATMAGGLVTMTMAVGSREHQWMQLLQARPSTDDSDEMPSWMNSVIAISEGGSSMEPVTVTPPSPAQKASTPVPSVRWENTAAPASGSALAPAPTPTIQVAAPVAPIQIINAPAAAAPIAAAPQVNGLVNATPGPAPVSWNGLNVTVTKVAARTQSMAMPPPPSSLNGTTTTVPSLQPPVPAPAVSTQPVPAPQALTVTMQPAAQTSGHHAPAVTMQPAVAPVSSIAPAPAIIHLATSAPAAARQMVVQQAMQQAISQTSVPSVAAQSPVVMGGLDHAPSTLPQKPEVSV